MFEGILGTFTAIKTLQLFLFVQLRSFVLLGDWRVRKWERDTLMLRPKQCSDGAAGAVLLSCSEGKHYIGLGVDLLAMPGLHTWTAQLQLSKAENSPHSRHIAVGRFGFRHAGGGPHSSSVSPSSRKVKPFILFGHSLQNSRFLNKLQLEILCNCVGSCLRDWIRCVLCAALGYMTDIHQKI